MHIKHFGLCLAHSQYFYSVNQIFLLKGINVKNIFIYVVPMSFIDVYHIHAKIEMKVLWNHFRCQKAAFHVSTANSEHHWSNNFLFCALCPMYFPVCYQLSTNNFFPCTTAIPHGLICQLLSTSAAESADKLTACIFGN